jgi:hypothetical protein
MAVEELAKNPTACPHLWHPYPTPQGCGCTRAYCKLCLVPQLPAHEPECPYGGDESFNQRDETDGPTHDRQEDRLPTGIPSTSQPTLATPEDQAANPYDLGTLQRQLVSMPKQEIAAKADEFLLRIRAAQHADEQRRKEHNNC